MADGLELTFGGHINYEAELKLTEKLAPRGSRDVDNELLYDKAQKEIAERKRVEDELRFQKALLEAQSEAYLDGLLFVSFEGKPISFNRCFVEMWEIPRDVVATNSNETIVQHVVDKLVDPEGFLAWMAYLYKHPDEESRDEILLKDGRVFDRYSAPVRGKDDTYYGRVWYFRDVTERKRAEEKLHRSLDALLAIYEAGHILGSTLEAEEVGSNLLQLMRRISHSITAVISRPDEHRQLRVWQAIGFDNLWRRARFTPEVQATLRRVLESGEHAHVGMKPPSSTAEPLVGLFLPLRMRNQTIGVLEIYGPDAIAEKEMVDILLSLTVKAASALENARLYGELAQRERMLQDLVGKLLRAQEEERRHVAYEVHDGLAQVAVAAHQHLQAFSRRYPPTTERSRSDLERVLKLVRQTVSDARKIISNLRPTALDDFGLAVAVSLEADHMREEGYRVDYEEELGGERLPDAVEIALFRIAQEALTNVRKHAQTQQVRIKLSRQGDEEVRLEVRDHGCGFDPKAPFIGSGPGERTGLAGIRERVSILDGRLEIHSQQGAGTSIMVVIPVPAVVEEDW